MGVKSEDDWDRERRYFVEYHFAQVQDAWAIPLRELRERYAAVDGIINGPDDAMEAENALAAAAARLRQTYA